MGSAGTFRFAIRCRGVTEVRPGTYVFNDRSQLAQGAAGPADLAAFVVTTVVGRPAPDRIVVDAGSKVLTSDRMLVPDPPPSFGRVWGHDDWDVVRLSEEHGVVERAAGGRRTDRRSRRDRAEPCVPGDQPRELRDRRRRRTGSRTAGRWRPAAWSGSYPCSPPASAAARIAAGVWPRSRSACWRSVKGFCASGQIGSSAHGAGSAGGSGSSGLPPTIVERVHDEQAVASRISPQMS